MFVRLYICLFINLSVLLVNWKPEDVLLNKIIGLISLPVRKLKWYKVDCMAYKRLASWMLIDWFICIVRLPERKPQTYLNVIFIIVTSSIWAHHLSLWRRRCWLYCCDHDRHPNREQIMYPSAPILALHQKTPPRKAHKSLLLWEKEGNADSNDCRLKHAMFPVCSHGRLPLWPRDLTLMVSSWATLSSRLNERWTSDGKKTHQNQTTDTSKFMSEKLEVIE